MQSGTGAVEHQRVPQSGGREATVNSTTPGIPGYETLNVVTMDWTSVLRAQRLDDGCEVTVKLLHRASEPLLPRRLSRVSKVLARPGASGGVLPVLEHGCAPDGQSYLVVPHLPLGSLQDRLEQGPSEWSSIAPVLARAVDIVAGIHAEGIVLGDLRPSKILLQTADRPVIAAFGMASRRFDDGQPSYRPPEAGNDVPPTAAADVYALSLIVGAVVTGRPKRPDEPIEAFLDRVAGAVPPPILDVLEHGTAASETNRYRSAGAMARALGRVLDIEPALDDVEPFERGAGGVGRVELQPETGGGLPPGLADLVLAPGPSGARNGNRANGHPDPSGEPGPWSAESPLPPGLDDIEVVPLSEVDGVSAEPVGLDSPADLEVLDLRQPGPDLTATPVDEEIDDEEIDDDLLELFTQTAEFELEPPPTGDGTVDPEPGDASAGDDDAPSDTESSPPGGTGDPGWPGGTAPGGSTDQPIDPTPWPPVAPVEPQPLPSTVDRRTLVGAPAAPAASASESPHPVIDDDPTLVYPEEDDLDVRAPVGRATQRRCAGRPVGGGRARRSVGNRSTATVPRRRGHRRHPLPQRRQGPARRRAPELDAPLAGPGRGGVVPQPALGLDRSGGGRAGRPAGRHPLRRGPGDPVDDDPGPGRRGDRPGPDHRDLQPQLRGHRRPLRHRRPTGPPADDDHGHPGDPPGPERSRHDGGPDGHPDADDDRHHHGLDRDRRSDDRRHPTDHRRPDDGHRPARHRADDDNEAGTGPRGRPRTRRSSHRVSGTTTMTKKPSGRSPRAHRDRLTSLTSRSATSCTPAASAWPPASS